MTKGRYIPSKQRLAVFASMMLPEAERNELRRRKASAEEVISRFDLHHVVYFTWTKNNRWWNLDPQLKADHKQRTQTDIGIIAKSKRIRRKEAEHKVMLPSFTEEIKAVASAVRGWRKRKLPSRPFPKAARKLRGKK